ncbi:unnamed protein product [Prorocentrum cordatum]|nr:unnamed protein product [Polarella glacialis]
MALGRGHLPPGSFPALASTLRPPTSRRRTCHAASSSTAATALRVAAVWLPPGTLGAAALAALTGCSAPAAPRPQPESAAGAAAPGRGGRPARQPLGRLCQDTSERVVGHLWPPLPPARGGCGEVASERAGAGAVSPRSFEARLRQCRHIFGDLRCVAAVSAAWARHADRDGWPSTHAYLYQEPGTKSELRRRYEASARRLLLDDWFRHHLSAAHARGLAWPQQGSAAGLAGRVAGFLPEATR